MRVIRDPPDPGGAPPGSFFAHRGHGAAAHDEARTQFLECLAALVALMHPARFLAAFQRHSPQ
jgi:hypothetical protein